MCNRIGYANHAHLPDVRLMPGSSDGYNILIKLFAYIIENQIVEIFYNMICCIKY